MLFLQVLHVAFYLRQHVYVLVGLRFLIIMIDIRPLTNSGTVQRIEPLVGYFTHCHRG